MHTAELEKRLCRSLAAALTGTIRGVLHSKFSILVNEQLDPIEGMQNLSERRGPDWVD